MHGALNSAPITPAALRRAGNGTSADQPIRTLPMPARENRLFVVSNRLTLPEETQPGGLGHAICAALAQTRGIWLGWSGKVSEHPQLHVHDVGTTRYLMRDLNRADFEDYYLGFAHRTLWPLLHGRSDLIAYDRAALAGYTRVNAEFADTIAALIHHGDRVWVHDYHLLPLGSLLRQRGVRCRIGFFLHVPVPPPSVIAALPDHVTLLRNLAAYDVIGVQTEGDALQLRAYFAEYAPSERAVIEHIRAFPISIDANAVAAAAQQAASGAEIAQLRTSLGGRALLLGVDRLDYCKGLPQRFAAFGRLLERCPELHGRMTFVQIAPESRRDVPEVTRISRQLQQLAGAINSRRADASWTPIRYVNKNYPQNLLAGFYRAARVGLVTPLRDGMNLVAKEYVAAQDGDDPGVLVLSEFAGAAQELQAALIVNPFDPDRCAEAMRQALAMPLGERRERWRALHRVLQRHDVHAWTQAFMQALDDSEHAARRIAEREDELGRRRGTIAHLPLRPHVGADPVAPPP